MSSREQRPRRISAARQADVAKNLDLKIFSLQPPSSVSDSKQTAYPLGILANRKPEVMAGDTAVCGEPGVEIRISRDVTKKIRCSP
jgi:hypothetical protein